MNTGNVAVHITAPALAVPYFRPPQRRFRRYNVGLCVDMVRACVHFAFLARVDMVRACLNFAFIARVDCLHFAFLARVGMVRAALCFSRTC